MLLLLPAFSFSFCCQAAELRETVLRRAPGGGGSERSHFRREDALGQGMAVHVVVLIKPTMLQKPLAVAVCFY